MVQFQSNSPLYQPSQLEGEMPIDTKSGQDRAEAKSEVKNKNIFSSIRQSSLIIRFSSIVSSSAPVLNKPPVTTKLFNELTKPTSSFSKANALVDTLRQQSSDWKGVVKDHIQKLDRKALSNCIESLQPSKLRGFDREMLQVMLSELKGKAMENSLQFPQDLDLLLDDIQKNDKNLSNIELKELSKGAVNTVYTFTHEGKTFVFKPDPSALKITKKIQERLFGSAVASGIPPGDASHLPHRSVASAFVSKLINPQSPVSVGTQFAVINGQRGICMEMAAGVSPTVRSREVKEVPQTDISNRERTLMKEGNLRALAGLYEVDYVEIKDDRLFTGKTTFSSDFNPQSETTAEGLVDLHIFDIITGQVDRHPGNYKVDQGHVKAIDNDCSFGVNSLPENGDVKSQHALKGFIPNNGSLMLRMPPVINQKQYNQISNLYANRNALREGLRANLSEKEVAATITRLEKLYQHTNSSDCYRLKEREGFLSENAMNRLDPNNSYLARELMVLNPDQKGSWNNLRKSYIQPN